MTAIRTLLDSAIAIEREARQIRDTAPVGGVLEAELNGSVLPAITVLIDAILQAGETVDKGPI